MEADQLTFTHDGIVYRINPHIWLDHPNRIRLITVERIRDAVIAPDFEEDELVATKLIWKWFPELGSRGNYIKVVLEIEREIRFIRTSYLDSNMRRKRGSP